MNLSIWMFFFRLWFLSKICLIYSNAVQVIYLYTVTKRAINKVDYLNIMELESTRVMAKIVHLQQNREL